MNAVLDTRARVLLRNLIELYIRDGQPIGSRTLSRAAGLNLSPATVRNVMADLEEHGLIMAPHASAGRVPTASGYRLFVDALLEVRDPNHEDAARVERRLREAAEHGSKDLLGAASELLSSLTHLAGMVRLPRPRARAIRQIEFLRLGERRVLAILVMASDEVQNRVLNTMQDFSAAELTRMANYLNSHLAGRPLSDVREHLLREMRDHQRDLDTMMVAAIQLGERAVAGSQANDDDMLVAGHTQLLDYQELANVDRLRALLEAFQEKREILQIFDQCVQADQVQIFIGAEAGIEWFEDCSAVTAPYRVDGEVVGVLGVIGPARISYQRVIPIVDLTARMLGAALSRSGSGAE
ncbi:MAG: heat-inducible transcriptional repressor HrcA [Thioalkalivibrionaceae bacterium]